MERYDSGSHYLERAGSYTLHDVLRVQEEAARLQAEVNAQAMTAVVGAIGRAAGWLLSGTAGYFRDQWASIAAYRLSNELGRFSDGKLARLGITRGEIEPYVAAQVGIPFGAARPIAASAVPGVVGGKAVDETAANEEPARRRAA